MNIFDKNAFWKVLNHLALNPSTSYYVNGLSRELDISAGMSSQVLREMEGLGLVGMKKRGNAHFYKLRENYLTTEIKRFSGLYGIYRNGLAEALAEIYPNHTSIVLYGSYTKGDFTENSDIDILVLTNDRKGTLPGGLEDVLKAEKNVEVFTPGQWLKMKKADEPFYAAVKCHHILLSGGNLP